MRSWAMGGRKMCYLVNAGKDFHLTAGASNAIDKGVSGPSAGVDIDGQGHDQGAPDLGADEVKP